MVTQTIDKNHFQQKARQVRARVPVVLSQWGLPPKFNRWRLTQDPETGLVVLFAVLNNKYIAAHTSTPFSDYFDPRLLLDLATDLHMQVVSCNSDGLRYAFILDSGSLEKLPTHIEFPFLDGDRLFIRVVFGDSPLPEGMKPQIAPEPLDPDGHVNDRLHVHQGVNAFVRVFDDIPLEGDAATIRATLGLPNVVVIDKEEFNKRVEALKVHQ